MAKQQTKRKYVLLSIVVIIVIAVAAGVYWYTQIKLPHNSAVSSFEKIAKNVKSQNDNVESTVSSAQAILDSGNTPFDEATITNLQVAISEARESLRSIPARPIKTKDILVEIKKLKEPIDYSNLIKNVEENQTLLESSIAQMAQITNPTGDFVVLRLQQIAQIGEIQGVTEDNDPNGSLNKQGGYTSATYFTSTLVNQEDVYGSGVVEKGTNAGGCVEVYANIEDAQKRNEYLALFDGAGIMNSGSHNIFGTIVIRTSSKLTASQQAELETQIKEKLIALQ